MPLFIIVSDAVRGGRMIEFKLRNLLSELGVEVSHKNSSNWLQAKCPFAEKYHISGTDNSPSFNVKINDDGLSAYKCFSCKRHGTLEDLVFSLGRMRGRDYTKYLLLCSEEGKPESFPDFEDNHYKEVEELEPLDFRKFEVAMRIYPEAYSRIESKDYLLSRGVSESTSKLLNLRYDPSGNRVLFPVMDNLQQVYGYTGRLIGSANSNNPKVKDYFGLRKERLLLGEHLVEKGKPILVVEGLFALAHMIEIGVREFCNPVATMGSYLSDFQRDKIIDYDSSIFLLYDDDEAGDLGIAGAVEKLKAHVPTFIGLYPEEVDDPDDLDFDQVKEMVVGEYSLLA